MNSHTDLQQNGLESLMNDNYIFETYMNDILQNGDVSSGNVFTKQPHYQEFFPNVLMEMYL